MRFNKIFILILLVSVLCSINIISASDLNNSDDVGLPIQELDFPEIVLAQALLETGYFKSACCTQKNNLFGMRSKSGGYMQFNHWTESVSAYKKYIQKYKQTPDDYYVYLVNMNYASDPNYINKLKQIKSNQIKSNLNYKLNYL
jgi:flagellum-specific peptidoglycan hydrolase FlgJ